MPGKLKNRTRLARTYNLTTKVAPVRHLFARREEHKDGTVKTHDRRLVLPDSVTVLGGGFSDLLPDGAPHCPEVAAAIARREVEWVPEPEKKAEPKSEQPKAAESEPTKVEPESEKAEAEGSPRARRKVS